MNFSFEHKHHHSLYFKYSVTFICVALFVYGTYFVTGHSLIWRLDGANQHLPLLIEFRQHLINFIHHPSLANLGSWNWQMGLGNDSFQVNSYYLLGDLFAYLVLLFPVSKVIFAYQLLIILKLYCAGLAFCWCAGHFKLKNIAIITGSLVYLFNAFLLYSNVAQPFFTIPFIIFPILIVNLERAIQGRSVWPLTLTFTWMLINNFYFAYIMGLGAIIYLLIRLWWTRHESRNYLVLFGKLAGATVLSLLNAAVLLLPEIIAVRDSTRTSSSFANGLKVYPLYYYLSLPDQLINGGNRDFYFWTALGFASIAFFAIIYTLKSFKKYATINTIFILSLILLLIPACGSLFNGLLAPSNRWTLMLCLPVALACAFLVENVNDIAIRSIRVFTIAAIIYIIYICVDYFFQNNEKIFIPVVFFFITFGGMILINQYHPKKPEKILFWITLLNVICNAVYFEAPFNEGYANEMLPSNSYSQLAKSEYGNLTKDLTNKTGYRVSTISKNSNLGANYHMYNNQDPNVSSICSYYSLQNKYLGKFAQNLQNIQFEANIPLAQFDDRTVVNNFFGVKYLFAHDQQPHSKKIPAGYKLDDSTLESTYNNDRILRYQTDQNFPLIYWQDKVFTQKQADQMSATQKERALADGVVVNQKTKLAKASIKNQIISLPFKLISSHGNLIDSKNLQQLDPNESYRVILDTQKLTSKQTDALKNAEIHLEFEDLHYSPFSLQNQVKLQQTAADYRLDGGMLSQNSMFNVYRAFRSNIINGLPDQSFTITASTSLGDETIKQPKTQILSFYKKVTNGTMNLGYFTECPSSIKLDFNNLGTYSFKLKLVAEPLGKKYADQVKQIQHHRLKQLSLTKAGATGTITTSKVGILTSSIPYSRGWEAYDNGKKVPLMRTNTAFLGIKLATGTHHIQFKYHVPGLKIGILISSIGILITVITGVGTIILKKRQKH